MSDVQKGIRLMACTTSLVSRAVNSKRDIATLYMSLGGGFVATLYGQFR